MLDASALKSSCCLSVDGIWDLRCLAFVYMVCWLFAVPVVGCPLPVPCWMLQKKIKGLKGVRVGKMCLRRKELEALQKCIYEKI